MSGIGKLAGGLLGGLMGGGDKTPAVAPAPPAPSADPAAKAAADEAARQERLRRAGGRGADILTSPTGDTSSASVARKVLLGQ